MHSFSAILVIIVIYRTGVDAIMKGRRIDIRKAPFVAMIYDRSRFNETNSIICGGTIVSNRHILTAAHCFTNNANIIRRKNLVVVAGENYYHSGAEIYKIGSVHIHPKFTTNYKDDVTYQASDIAVVELTDEIQFGPTRQPIKLAEEEPAPNSMGNIYGWGVKDLSIKSNSRTLQGTVVQVFPFKDCKEATPELPFLKDELCIIGFSGRTICDGDSGGPLIVNRRIAGILSRGQDCEGQATAINVAYYKSSIESILRRYWSPWNT